MGDPPRVQAIVLNWNKPRETAACLESLLRQEYPNCRITLVDNASRDDPQAVFRDYLGRIALIRTERNLGYTGGNNLAIERALADAADYVWLVNNDVEAAPDCLSKLVAAAQADPTIGLAGPVIRYHGQPGRIWTCGGRFMAGTCLTEWFDRLDSARAAMAAHPDAFMLPGTVLLVRRALLQSAGAFDDRFFAYYEDVDLAIRAANAGFRSVLVDDADAYHKKEPGALIPPHIYYYLTRNELFIWRPYAGFGALLRKAVWQFNTLLNQLVACDGHPEHQQAMLAGYWHGLIGRTGMYRPEHRMPWPLRRLLVAYPRLIRGMLLQG